MTGAFRAALACVAAALALAACESGSGIKPTPLEPLDAPKIAGREVWRHDIGNIDFPLAVAVRQGRFYVADTSGSVVALDAQTGSEVWRADAGDKIAAGVGSDGRFAAVVTRGNEVVVFDAGRELWRRRVPSRVVTPPLVAGERVFVTSVDRAVLAFDVQDGRRLWTLQRPGDALTLAQGGVIAPFGDTLLVGQGSKLAAIEPLRGLLRWETALATQRGTNEIERLADLVGPPVRDGNRICARAFQAAVGCADATTGKLLWTKNVGGGQAVGGNADLVVGADGTGRVTAWRAGNGDVAWTNEKLLYRNLSGAVVAGPTAVFGDLEGYVHWLSLADGSLQLRLPTDGSQVIGTPVLSDQTLLVVTQKGGLHAFRPS